MLTYTILILLTGMVLGQRFKLFVLVPTIVIVMTVAIGFGLAQGDPIWWAVLMAFAASAALQIGYFAGIVIHHMLLVVRHKRVSTSGSHANPTRPALESND